jgi:hypothetical protein
VNTLLSSRYRNLPYDSQCGLKIFRPESLQGDILEAPFRTRWFADVELLVRANLLAGKTWEEPLEVWNDIDGSKIRTKESFRIFKEIAQLLLRP